MRVALTDHAAIKSIPIPYSLIPFASEFDEHVRFACNESFNDHWGYHANRTIYGAFAANAFTIIDIARDSMVDTDNSNDKQYGRKKNLIFQILIDQT
ncbi:hypothetical protein [Shimazuella alba]|uniref:Uncharacterized protein n=1 Tax=Shimazuella alba TaxID=2690964 RepID=A0A6I4VVC4_9BACL|nr:hypothetical protein [Shimazuella alba]MXQ52474.1 hypothetical protein [Shimazuella alba]